MEAKEVYTFRKERFDELQKQLIVNRDELSNVINHIKENENG